ncbi:GNAT family N-acetyltransferase [Winogradskyella undariae]|uniref:GNAT family N-acetyltransferase n=1 Tax=Winogradskyella TaxID=286104 RepID=UPI00156BB30F|nr:MULTISPECIES: GNAT family N-acetyltransferase [Winogradskyella]NRR89952.1 GNAT family N-acetyltransferase [Winogradskyella undariae]QXP80715.1 GNAT family N-acetyltransferase [Winogradskyella sp. HaHa_3_26]
MKQPRLAVIQDMPRVIELIQELATFEKETDAVEITQSDLEKDGFGTNPKFTCFVSELENKIEGIALVYPRYSTWKGPILHLEDLIVSENSRGKGLGTLLLDAVVKHAKQLGVKRVSWEVLDWNEPAIKFYESKGANVMRDWNVAHLNEKGIENYLNQL